MNRPSEAALAGRLTLWLHVFGVAFALASSGALAQSCTVSAGATLAFPPIVALASTGNQATDTGQSLQIACDSSVAGTVRLYSGTPRVMSNGPHRLPFNLSLSSGAAINDLSIASPGTPLNITRNGQPQSVTLYSKVFVQDFKALPAGLYSTSITLTVEY